MSPLRNRLLCIDAVAGMRALPSSSIPLTVTSPPYDSIRDYGGHLWDWEKFALIAHELWRVTIAGGVVCWVVRDQIKKGSQTGSSFRQVLFFRGLGFRIHNVLVIEKQVTRGINPVRYGVAPEFAFVLSKGRPRSINLLKKRNKYAGRLMRYSSRKKDGTIGYTQLIPIKEFGNKGLVWRYTAGGGLSTKDRFAFGQTAIMPEKLAGDLIVSWSRPGDVVLDPLGGSGTTAKLALLSDRQYLSFEVHRPYHEIAVRRLTEAHEANRRRLEVALGIG